MIIRNPPYLSRATLAPRNRSAFMNGSTDKNLLVYSLAADKLFPQNEMSIGCQRK